MVLVRACLFNLSSERNIILNAFMRNVINMRIYNSVSVNFIDNNGDVISIGSLPS